MRFVVLSLIIILISMPIAAAEQPYRVSEVSQPPVERQVERQADSTLNQPPNQANGIFSDEGCDICGSPQVLAENFAVVTGGLGFNLEQIVIWGAYYPANIPVPVDDFDVLVHLHDGAINLPGAVICSETGIVPTSRTATGTVLFGVDEYMVTLDLTLPCNLADGTYWVEVYNNTGTGTDDWFWETGTLDPVNGVVGSAWSGQAPGVSWVANTFDEDLAMLLNGTVLPVELQSFSIE